MNFEFRVIGRDLPVKDQTTSDPYFQFTLINGQVIYKSEVVKKNLNPVWENFKIASSAIGHDKKAEIKVEVRDYDLLSKDDYMGTGYFKISKIVGGVAKKVELCNEDTGGSGMGSGDLRSSEMSSGDLPSSDLPSSDLPSDPGPPFHSRDCWKLIDKS